MLIKKSLFSIQLNGVNTEEVDGALPRFGLSEEGGKSGKMMKSILKARRLGLPDGTRLHSGR